MQGADRTRLIAVAVLLAVAIPLVVIAAAGGGDGDAEGEPPLRVERSNQLPEMLLYIDDESVNKPARTGGRREVRVECLDADGVVLASQAEVWPMTQTDGNTLAPHAHIAVNPGRIGDVVSCRISGTEPLLAGDVS